MQRLTCRTDFLAAAKGLRASYGAFVVQARQRAEDGPARIGFTVSRQGRQCGGAQPGAAPAARGGAAVGGRRHARPGHDYVLIGRRAALASAVRRDRGRISMRRCARIHDPERPGGVAESQRTGRKELVVGRARSPHEPGSGSAARRHPGRQNREPKTSRCMSIEWASTRTPSWPSCCRCSSLSAGKSSSASRRCRSSASRRS